MYFSVAVLQLCVAVLCVAALCVVVLCVAVLCVSVLFVAVVCVLVLCVSVLCVAVLCVAAPSLVRIRFQLFANTPTNTSVWPSDDLEIRRKSSLGDRTSVLVPSIGLDRIFK